MLVATNAVQYAYTAVGVSAINASAAITTFYAQGGIAAVVTGTLSAAINILRVAFTRLFLPIAGLVLAVEGVMLALRFFKKEADETSKTKLDETLQSLADGSLDVKETLDNLTSSVDLYKSAADDAFKSSVDLEKSFGDQASAMRRLFDEKLRLAEVEARLAAQQAVNIGFSIDNRAVRNFVADVDDIVDNYDRLQRIFSGESTVSARDPIKNMANNVGKLATELNLTKQGALDYAVAIRAAQAAAASGDTERMADAVKVLYDTLNAALIPGAELSNQMLEYLQQLVAGEIKLREFLALTQSSASSAEDLADALRDAVSAMASLGSFADSLDKALAVSAAKVEAIRTGANAAVAGNIAGMRMDLDRRMQEAVDTGVDRSTVERMYGGQRGRIGQLESSENERVRLQETSRDTARTTRSGQSDFERDLENAQKIFDGLYDSAEAYRGRLESIQLQYQSGEITLQQYTDAMEQLKEATADGTYVMESAQQALIDYSANAVKYGDEIANALTSAFKGAEDALTDFVMTGKLDFNDLANSIVADITRIAIRSAILGPLASSLGGALGGGGGLGSMLAGVFHNGGIVGAGGNAGRKISATAFIGAPRFHDGGMVGLRPNEVPAILERGEKVIPKDKVDKGGSVTVNMTINTPDANSFRRSENQVASMARMALQRAQRNM